MGRLGLSRDFPARRAALKSSRVAWHTVGMATREDVHRLVDAVPAARLEVVEQLLRASVSGAVSVPPRRFASAGTLAGEPDLAERSEDVVRSVVGEATDSLPPAA